MGKKEDIAVCSWFVERVFWIKWFYSWHVCITRERGTLKFYVLSFFGYNSNSTLFQMEIFFFFREFAKSVKRPYSVRYDPYTQRIEMLKDTRSIEKVVQDIRRDLATVCDTLSKMNKNFGIWGHARQSHIHFGVNTASRTDPEYCDVPYLQTYSWLVWMF